jgi:outer membrane protein TolC
VKTAIALFLAIAVAAPAAGAPSARETPRTLDDFLRLARAGNPSRQAADARAVAARERIGVARGYPDPALLYGYYVAPGALQGRQEIRVMQPIPFFGKRGQRGDVAESAAEMERHTSRAVALDIDAAVKMTFYDYVRRHETARVLEDEAHLLGQMRDVIQTRYAAERAEQQDVLKVTLAISQLDDQITLNDRELAVAQARLNELIGRDASAPLEPPAWSVPGLVLEADTALVDSALARRPEMASARAGVEMADRSRSLAGKEYWPNLLVGFMYEFGADRDDMWEVMAGIDIPIWIGKRNAQAREAEAMQTGATHTLRAETLRTRREVREAWERVRAGEERRVRFETVILPQAEQTFQSSEAGYRAGRVDFIDYLDSERVLLATRREYYDVIADLGAHLALLERAIAADVTTDAR